MIENKPLLDQHDRNAEHKWKFSKPISFLLAFCALTLCAVLLNSFKHNGAELSTPVGENSTDETSVGADVLRMLAGGTQYKHGPRPPRCGDANSGYEAKVGPCSALSTPTFLSMTSRVSIPKVLNPQPYCKSIEGCSKADASVCCMERPQCMMFERHISGGCKDDTGVAKSGNPYEYAFCQTSPCTEADRAHCCIPTTRQTLVVDKDGAQPFTATVYVGLYERIKRDRSNPSKDAPSETAKSTNPAITFSMGSIAWLDMNAVRIDPTTHDVYAPLVDFMDTWGSGPVWGHHGAWMKVMKHEKGTYKYKPVFYDEATQQLGSWKDLYETERRVKHPDAS